MDFKEPRTGRARQCLSAPTSFQMQETFQSIPDRMLILPLHKEIPESPLRCQLYFREPTSVRPRFWVASYPHNGSVGNGTRCSAQFWSAPCLQDSDPQPSRLSSCFCFFLFPQDFPCLEGRQTHLAPEENTIPYACCPDHSSDKNS